MISAINDYLNFYSDNDKVMIIVASLGTTESNAFLF